MEFTLEKWKAEDYFDFFNASADDELRANMSDTFPATLDECKQVVRVFSQSTDTTEYIRAIKIDNQAAGCIAAFLETDMYRKNAEIAYWLKNDHRGKGVMPQVIEIFTRDLFLLFDLHRIYARPFEQNRASVRALEKAGFSYEGTLKQNVYKNGMFINSVVYSIIKS